MSISIEFYTYIQSFVRVKDSWRLDIGNISQKKDSIIYVYGLDFLNTAVSIEQSIVISLPYRLPLSQFNLEVTADKLTWLTVAWLLWRHDTRINVPLQLSMSLQYNTLCLYGNRYNGAKCDTHLFPRYLEVFDKCFCSKLLWSNNVRSRIDERICFP